MVVAPSARWSGPQPVVRGGIESGDYTTVVTSLSMTTRTLTIWCIRRGVRRFMRRSGQPYGTFTVGGPERACTAAGACSQERLATVREHRSETLAPQARSGRRNHIRACPSVPRTVAISDSTLRPAPCGQVGEQTVNFRWTTVVGQGTTDPEMWTTSIRGPTLAAAQAGAIVTGIPFSTEVPDNGSSTSPSVSTLLFTPGRTAATAILVPAAS